MVRRCAAKNALLDDDGICQGFIVIVAGFLGGEADCLYRLTIRDDLLVPVLVIAELGGLVVEDRTV